MGRKKALACLHRGFSQGYNSWEWELFVMECWQHMGVKIPQGRIDQCAVWTSNVLRGNWSAARAGGIAAWEENTRGQRFAEGGSEAESMLDMIFTCGAIALRRPEIAQQGKSTKGKAKSAKPLSC